MEDKTMKKVFGIAALLLALAACNKETEITPVEQPSDSKGITITATLAPKTAVTKAVADKGDGRITVSWAQNEHISILYEVDETKYSADAEIISVDDEGTATIQFTVVDGTPDNTACTLVYPYSAAKDDKSGVKDAATLLSAQDGTLNANLDVRVGAGTIRTTTPGLDVTTQPKAQFAIFKFTVKNADASATIDVKSLTITIGTQKYVITPASAKSSLYVALPAVSNQTVSFSATGSDSKTYICSKDGVTFAAAKYYQSTLKMSEPPLLTTITATGKEQASYSTANVATVSFSYTAGGSSAYLANWGWWGYGWIATVTPADGYTITKCVFYDDANRTATDSEAPFVVETTEEDKTPKVNGTPILAYTSKGIKKIDVYGYVTP